MINNDTKVPSSRPSVNHINMWFLKNKNLHNLLLQCLYHCFSAAVDMQFGVDVFDVGLHGGHANEKRCSNHFVAIAFH